MTFTEAALEVLRSAGEPLHYKKITEIAIEKNLLSHVGKTPEVTMSSRLATMVKKDRGSAPIIKVKPGVFAIREDLREDPEALNAALEQLASSTPDSGDEAQADNGKERPSLPGADVFPEEDDDDDPILAGLEEDEGEDKGRRRRRRRRRGKGDSDGDGDEPSVRTREGREGREGRDSRNGRGRDRGRGRRDEPAPEVELDREPGDGDLLGKGLADAVWSVLSRAERGGVTFARAAELLVRRGRMSGQGSALAPTIAAALRADVAASERAGEPRRFLLRNGKVALTDWLLPKELGRANEAAERAAERQREQARRAWAGKINELPLAGFAELVATWLNAEGVSSLRAVRRPGSGAQELHFAGTEKRGPVEARLAVVVLRGGREIDRETVVRVRGSLHHYGNATAAWIVTTGRLSSGAREEVTAVPAAPVALFDAAQLAAAMEACGVGLRSRRVTVSEIDFELFEALGGDIGLRDARRERDSADGDSGDGERRRRRGRGRGRDEDSDEEQDESGDDEGASDSSGTGDAADPSGAGDSSSQDGEQPGGEQPGEAAASEREGEEGGGRSRSRRRRRRGGRGGRGQSDERAEAKASEDSDDDERGDDAARDDDDDGDEDDVSTDVVDMSKHLDTDRGRSRRGRRGSPDDQDAQAAAGDDGSGTAGSEASAAPGGSDDSAGAVAAAPQETEADSDDQVRS